MLRATSCSVQGRRHDQEDRLVEGVPCGPDGMLYAVLDGHVDGSVADFVAHRLGDPASPEGRALADAVSRLRRGTPLRRAAATMRLACRGVFAGMHAQSAAAGLTGGTTVAFAVVTQHHVVVANIGDSYVGLFDAGSGVCEFRTRAHTPADAREAERLGRAQTPRPWQVVFDGRYVMTGAGFLAVTRAIGDHAFPHVIPTPDVTVLKRGGAGRNVLVLASDGVTDAFEDADAALGTLLSSRGGRACVDVDIDADADADADVLVQRALRSELWNGDNTSAIVVEL